MNNQRILVISDTHAPFWHQDTVPFLRAIKKKYKPDRVIHIGDELDYHAISFHTHNPDLMSPSDELEKAVAMLSFLYELFPTMDLLESNHGSLVYRKAQDAGLPSRVLKSYRDVLGAPRTWKWHFDLIVKMSNGQDCYFTHGKSSNGLRLSQMMGMCVTQGHHHGRFGVQYWNNSKKSMWSLQVGCLIDNPSISFAYNKINIEAPIIGCACIINGLPVLLPMVMDGKGRWTKKLP